MWSYTYTSQLDLNLHTNLHTISGAEAMSFYHYLIIILSCLSVSTATEHLQSFPCTDHMADRQWLYNCCLLCLFKTMTHVDNIHPTISVCNYSVDKNLQAQCIAYSSSVKIMQQIPDRAYSHLIERLKQKLIIAYITRSLLNDVHRLKSPVWTQKY
jgi:hypothetical protein